MLKEIIANFLQIPEQQAQTLIDLLTLEKMWQETPSVGNKVIDPSKIKTQLELIEFLQGIGQSKWFQGHDRSKFLPHMAENIVKENYWNLFDNLGMTKAITSDIIPDYSVVLGSSEMQVIHRTESLIQDLSRGIIPKSHIILGCGCGRELGKSVLSSEQRSIDRLTAQKIPLTEMNMVSLIIEEQLAQYHFNKTLKYIPVDAGGASDRMQANFATTMHNAEGILETIKKLNADQKKLAEPTIVTIYSNQPHTRRQARDIEEKLQSEKSGTLYQVNNVGEAYNKEVFFTSPTSINLFLGEIARLINIMYKRLGPLVANTPLTQEEQQELDTLTTNIKIEQTVTIEQQQITKESFQPVFQLTLEKVPSNVENSQASSDRQFIPHASLN